MKLSSIGPVVSEEKMVENVDRRTDDGRTTDAGVTGILIAHLGSGELKMVHVIFHETASRKILVFTLYVNPYMSNEVSHFNLLDELIT